MFAGLFTNRKTSNESARPALVPPFPQPLSHKRIAVADLGQEGLVLYPCQDSKRSGYKGKAALVPYGKSGTLRALEEFDSQTVQDQAKYTSYGVLGVLKLFQETYLLLISSKRDVGQYADSDRKSISCLTGILAIPLADAAKARDVLATASETQAQDKGSNPVLEQSTGGLSDISRSSTASSTDDSDAEQEEKALTGRASASDVFLKGGNNHAEHSTAATTTTLEDQKAKRPRTSLSSGIARYLWPSLQAKHTAEASELVSLANTVTPPRSATSQSEAAELVNASAKVQDMSSPTTDDSQVMQPGDSETASMAELDKKILREALAELTNGAMYFSQDFDLTRCTQTRWQMLKEEKAAAKAKSKSPKAAQGPADKTVQAAQSEEDVLIDMRTEEPFSSTSLAQRADKRFWWNNWLSRPLMDAGLEAFVTVLMQGFVQIQSVTLVAEASVEQKPATSVELSLAVISRRSVERPGLRYQRRGINAAGGVANFTETELVLSCETAFRHQISSYVQTRGSIPLYWSQSPWSLKPVPVLERSEEENRAAISRHFEKHIRNYFGRTIIVNLAEQEGNEGLVVKAYREAVAALGRPEVKYTEWDFHGECRGMKYENIAKLLDERAEDIEHISSFWSLDSQKLQLQTGAFRTNCMDCLDRTNVVQSAFARNHLSTFLIRAGLGPIDGSSKEQLDLAFNAIFADNGDAISRTYAGTSALKGDFVRSGKRNWRGQFNDATNSLARFYQNTVLDFFKQSMIDYITGINLNAFAEFGEKMQSSDPGEIVRLANIRKSAIETAAKTVISEGEKHLHGWTLLSPAENGRIKDTAFEEKILLVTKQAIYCCSFEYTLQKVRDFVRIPLGQIVGLQQGEYILSALDASARNVEENYGLVVQYLPQGAVSRSRTYSVRNKTSPIASPVEGEAEVERLSIAFKAIRGDMIRDLESTRHEIRISCRQQVEQIIEHLRQGCEDVGSTDSSDASFVRHEPIISLAEAKAQVGLLDRLNYELKHMIWL